VKVLEVLNEEGIKGTFFCLGKNASANPELVKKMDEQGHIIGNHTFSHTYVFSQQKAEHQMLEGQKVFEGILKKTPRFFRPPFGVMNPKIADAVRKLNYVIIGWDLRSRDGTTQSKDPIVKRVSNLLSKSSILLFHDTNPVTAEAVKEVIHLCKQNGIEIVSLPELIGVEPYA
jgi:peptidoglycan/xylan/chitin deacetylase (PgdA/CDA1 family)